MKLQPVLEKLHGLDPKTFGMLNQMLDQAQVMSLLQEKTEPMDMQDRLAKLGPILDKLKNLDPKTAGMLGKMVGIVVAENPRDLSKALSLGGWRGTLLSHPGEGPESLLPHNSARMVLSVHHTALTHFQRVGKYDRMRRRAD